MPKFHLFAVIVLCSVGALPVRSLAQATDEKPKKKRENVFLHPQKFYRKFFPTLRVKKDPPDTAYIKTYPNYLSAGVHILSPSIRFDVKTRSKVPGGVNAASQFRTNIPDILGFSVSYRMVTAGFAFLTKTGMNTHDDYSPSKYKTATIKYNSKAYAFQFKYIRLEGFTDINPSNRADVFQPYRLRRDLLSKEFQFENIYNVSWRKYSYVAPLTFSQRQVKSRAGFLLKTGVYYDQLSGDSAILAPSQRPYFDDLSDVTTIRSLSVRVAPGFGINKIFHRSIYFSFVGFTSYDLFLYKYLTSADDKVSGKAAGIFVLEGKASLGYQSRRLYAGIRYETEHRFSPLQGIWLNTTFNYTGIEFGYRFGAPDIVKKVYKETMPPGF